VLAHPLSFGCFFCGFRDVVAVGGTGARLVRVAVLFAVADPTADASSFSRGFYIRMDTQMW